MKLQEKIDYVQQMITACRRKRDDLQAEIKNLDIVEQHLVDEHRKMCKEQSDISEFANAAIDGAKIGGSLPVVEDASSKAMLDVGIAIGSHLGKNRGHETPKMEGEYTTRKTFGKSPLDVIAEENFNKEREASYNKTR